MAAIIEVLIEETEEKYVPLYLTNLVTLDLPESDTSEMERLVHMSVKRRLGGSTILGLSFVGMGIQETRRRLRETTERMLTEDKLVNKVPEKKLWVLWKGSRRKCGGRVCHSLLNFASCPSSHTCTARKGLHLQETSQSNHQNCVQIRLGLRESKNLL